MLRRFILWMMIVIAVVITAVAAAPSHPTAPPSDQLTGMLWPAMMGTSAATAVIVAIIRIVEHIQAPEA
jgi:hypothetical protein